jgi:O-antigen/teichoic acid export membrane protein
MTSELRQTAIYFTTVAVGQGLGLFLLPIVTRFLSAEAYGEYALMLAVSGFVGMIASAWIRNVGLRLYFDAVERRATRSFYVSTAALQTVLFLALYGLTVAVMALIGYEIASLRVVISAGVMVLIGDQFAYAVTLLRAEQRTTPFAVAEIGAGAVRFVATVLGLIAGIRSAELLFDATSLGYLLGTGYAVPALWKRLVGPGGIERSVVAEILRVGPASIPFSLSSWLQRLADRFVLQYFLGTAVVGVYTVGYTLGERIIGSLVQAVFMMAWPNILNAWRHGGTGAARSAISEAQRLYAWVSIGPMVFLVAYGGTFTRWVVGPAFHDADVVVPIVAVSMWIGGFASYLNRHLELTKRFGRLSAVSLAGALINVALNIALIPPYGMVGAATATLANHVFNAAVFYFTRDRDLTVVNVRALGLASGTAAALWYLLGFLPVGESMAMAAFALTYAAAAAYRLLVRP